MVPAMPSSAFVAVASRTAFVSRLPGSGLFLDAVMMIPRGSRGQPQAPQRSKTTATESARGATSAAARQSASFFLAPMPRIRANDMRLVDALRVQVDVVEAALVHA